MCKYCEGEKKTENYWEDRDGTKHYIYLIGERNGGLFIVRDSCHGYMLEDLEGIYMSEINYCPWCGRKL